MPKKLRLKVIACGVFEQELEYVAERSPNDVVVELLDAGLHAAPDKLRLFAQEAIDAAAREGGYDAVCLAYGLCGRGTTGLITRDVPVVLPRVHDCIALFLGSARAYAEQFSRYPGSFYFTTGWYKHKAHPERTRIAATRRLDPTTHPHYAEFSEQYGADNARYIIEFMESWRRNYQRAVLIDHGFATAEHEATTRAVADAAGWDYERLAGSLDLIEGLVSGEWDEERFLVAPPDHVIVATNDERITAAVRRGATTDERMAEAGLLGLDASHAVQEGTFFYEDGGAGTEAPGAELALGIDAGGTFTDAVLYEFSAGKLLSKAKAITTHGHLVDGITEALSLLDSDLFDRVSYTCLSSTLATNAIVEGRGLPVGLILMPYHEGMAAGIMTPLFRCIGGRTSIEGVVDSDVDEAEVLEAARDLAAQGAASFAVSGYGSVRNPTHESQVKDVLRRHFDLPIVCGHELSGKLNFIARAHTAVLNARLLPIVSDLLNSVEDVLAAEGVGGPLFVVRGDGAIMRKDVARERAIETVLSGPAASAAGGRFLTGNRDALVVDMGGTTTDIAALTDGRIALSPEGAQVGRWRTSVAAADIETSGLGGDSAVRPAARNGLQVGPERVLPISYLAAHNPGVCEELAGLVDQQADGGLSPSMFDFLVLVGRPEGLGLDEQEKRIVEHLSQQPHSRPALSKACGSMAPQLLRTKRLERVGLVRRAGVTPTDALHVLGDYSPYDVAAARLALTALGRFIGMSPEEVASAVRDETERLLALAIMRRELSDDGIDDGAAAFEQALPLLNRILDGDGDGAFRVLWQQRRPVIGIGAPVSAFLPSACLRLGIDAIIPPDADVANAVGAATSQVVVSGRMRIRPGEFGCYVLYGPEGRSEFARLADAQEAARDGVVTLVRRRALTFGTDEQMVRVDVARRVGRLQDGSTQLLEVTVDGVLAGAPKLS